MLGDRHVVDRGHGPVGQRPVEDRVADVEGAAKVERRLEADVDRHRVGKPGEHRLVAAVARRVGRKGEGGRGPKLTLQW